MDIIILAAGKGTRLKPLTDTTPKPLIPIAGRGALLRTLDLLPAQVTRVILVVGYLQDKIRETVGAEWNGRPVVYVETPILDGTGGALRAARDMITSERFFVVNGDDLYSTADLEQLLTHERGLLAAKRTLTSASDVWDAQDGLIRDIRRAESGEEAWINIGAYLLGHEWFETEPILSPGKTDEWSLPHPIPQLIEQIPYHLVEASFWQPGGTFEEIAEAEKKLAET